MRNLLLVILIALIPLAILAGTTVLVRRNRKDLHYQALAQEQARAARERAAQGPAPQERDGSADV